MSLISILKRKNKISLFTTPSHSGSVFLLHKFYKWYKNDISETDAYNPVEALEAAECKASKIYGTKSTHFLTNGSTSGIIVATLTSCKEGDKLLIWNNSHPSHRNAGILSKANIIEYEQEYSHEWGIYKPVSPDKVLNLIKENHPKTIIITSPTYEGYVADVQKIYDADRCYCYIMYRLCKSHIHRREQRQRGNIRRDALCR